MRPFVILLICCWSLSWAVDAQEGALPDLPGQIAYIGDDFNVYSLNLADGERRQLTDDANVEAASARIYQWPTWSNDGRLAYFGVDYNNIGGIDTTEVFISRDAAAPGNLAYSGLAEAFNYAYWSPRNCAEGDNCRDLAVLMSSQAANGLFVELIRETDSEVTSAVIGRGAPFYYSFSPDGTRMLWQRNNQRMDVYDIDTSEIISTLPQMPGAFFSPAWSPVDDRFLFGVLDDEDNTTDLIIAANDDIQTLAENLAGPVYFAWSPDGNKIAYTAERGPIQVYDPISGETFTATTDSGIVAFFWSPDSRSIAYVTLAQARGSFSADAGLGAAPLAKQQRSEIALAWSVLDAETRIVRRYSAFVPTRDTAYLLTYFDQFAQSHRLWSPDSQHIIYGELTPENEPVVTVLNVGDENTVPLLIAEGYIGVWSFE